MSRGAGLHSLKSLYGLFYPSNGYGSPRRARDGIRTLPVDSLQTFLAYSFDNNPLMISSSRRMDRHNKITINQPSWSLPIQCANIFGELKTHRFRSMFSKMFNAYNARWNVIVHLVNISKLWIVRWRTCNGYRARGLARWFKPPYHQRLCVQSSFAMSP